MHRWGPHRRSPRATRKHWVQWQLLRRGRSKEEKGRAEGKAGGHQEPTWGAATPGQQQPAVGHKSSRERPTRQGESSRHSRAAAQGTHRCGIPRERRTGTKRERGPGGPEGREGRVGQQAKQGRRQQQLRASGWAPAGACARPAAGMAAGKAPQASWSCWQPARAAASRAVCAAGGPPIPRHACVCVGGRHTRGGGNHSARRAQPASRSQRQAGRRLHSTGVGRGSSRACSHARRQLAGDRGRGAGRAGPEGRENRIKNTGCMQAGNGGGENDRSGRGPTGVTHQVGVGPPRGG